ncbi:MAG: hypothetical protein ACKO23_11925 [Gemmataceae bacterium]
MTDRPEADNLPRRPHTEYEDPHYHDEDDVAVPPPDDMPLPRNLPRTPSRGKPRLPPPPRRFHED